MLFFRGFKQILSVSCVSGLSLLSACSDSSDNPMSPMTNTPMNVIDYSFSLNSAQEPVIPAVISSATGSAELSLDTDSGTLSGSIVLSSNITATMAHIHSGAVGVSGAPVVTLIQDPANAQRFNLPMNTVLLATQVDEMVSGNYYVNVHTVANSGGELRGQILDANQSVLVTELTSTQVPGAAPITSTGAARAFTLLNNVSGAISGVLRLGGLTPTLMHIHTGYLGASGGPLVTLVQGSDPNVWDIPATAVLTPAQRLDLANGKLYFNVHTADHMAGELHGQIQPENIKLYVVSLAAAANVTTSATGIAYLTLNTATGLLNATVRTGGIAQITNMHIHDSANGNPVKGLTVTTDPTIWNVSDAILSATEITQLTSGKYYMNVHSSMYVAGELSGTID